MMQESLILAYRLALGALVLVILLRGTGPMKRTVAVFCIVYGLQLLLAVYLWPSWIWSACIAVLDLAAIRPVTWHPAGRVQSMIGWTFLLQAAAHAGRVIAELNNKIPDMNTYWWLTTALAFVQLFMIVGWLLHDAFRSSGHRVDGLGNPQGHPTHFKGVGR